MTASGWALPHVLVLRRTALTILGVTVALMLLSAGEARATHDTGAFELDGNAASQTDDDWDRVCHQVTITEDLTDGTNDIPNECASATDTNGATAVSWTAELDRNATIFTGGGSKDPEDISNWLWKDGAGGLPDKDNLLHAFAARYSLPANPNSCPSTTATCDVLYFGSDRFDNSGDAHQAFWFLQDEIGLTNVKGGGGFKFSGLHTPGDLLVISEFSNGGTRSTIAVYTWDPTVTGNLRLEASTGDPATNLARCRPALTLDPFCGIVNDNGSLTDAPWSFLDKSGNADYAQGEFYEAGVNLSTLGLADECFSSVVAETRSSTSTTATLKDFVLGSFDVCHATMTTLASVNNANGTLGPPVTPGTPVTDTATIAGSSPSHDPTGQVTFYLCSNVAAGGDCATGGTQVGNPVNLVGNFAGTSTATSSAVNTAQNPLGPGHYCFRAEWPGDLNYDGTPPHTNSTTECFEVKDVSSIITAQKWLPQDTATVTTQGGTPVSGTVLFKLFENGSCSGTESATFSDSSAPFETNNTTYRAQSTTISWLATFTPTDTNAVVGSTGVCEVSTLTIDNDGP